MCLSRWFDTVSKVELPFGGVDKIDFWFPCELRGALGYFSAA